MAPQVLQFIVNCSNVVGSRQDVAAYRVIRVGDKAKEERIEAEYLED